MNTKRDLVLKAAAGLIVPVLWAASLSAAVAGTPRSGAATVTRTGPNGNSSVRQSNVSTNGQGGYSANSTLTGPGGKTATRQQSGSYNPATQTYTRSGTTTGPNGKTSSFNTSVQATSNGFTQSRTNTGPNGKTATETRNVSVTPTGN